jgi:Holliday junction resolvase RusA-like endonuclease
MLQTLRIPGTMPGLNELMLAKGNTAAWRGKGGKVWNGYAPLKRAWGKNVRIFCQAQKIKPVTTRCDLRFTFTEAHDRRDPDNIASGAMKLILDGLVAAGILADDGQQQIGAITINPIKVDRNPDAQGVIIEIISED